MSKRKRKRSKEVSRPEPRPRSVFQMAMAHPLVALISLVATVAGSVFGALILLPRAIVSPPSEMTDPNNVLDVSFDVANGGLKPLMDTSACLAVGEVSNGPALSRGFRFDPSHLSRLCRDTWQHHDLGMDDRFTVRPTDVFTHATQADIAITVSYRPWFLPIRRERIFRFFAVKDYSGRTMWRSWPLTEARPVN